MPLYNEEKILTNSVRTIIDFLEETKFPYNYRIILANNESTDGSAHICRLLVEEYPDRVVSLDVGKKGKGLAIRTAWNKSDADILVFMDADLSSDLGSLQNLVKAVHYGDAHMSIGNRLGRESQVISRKILRKVASHIYNAWARILLGTRFDDHQCGFKAIKKESFTYISPFLKEEGFLIDTEILGFASRLGLSVKSVDIIWRDSDESKVSLFSDSLKMFLRLVKLRRRIALTVPQTTP